MNFNFIPLSFNRFALLLTAATCFLLFIVQPGRAKASLPMSAAADPLKAIVYPMDVIASQGWYITLPTQIHATPDTVKVGGSPDLMTYTDEWFHLNDTKDGVVFKARTDGALTANSPNPRSELREMSSDGKIQAAWSSTSGTHSMEIEQAVNVLPIGSKPVVVVGQIHDASDDVSVFRLEGNTSGSQGEPRNIGSLWITDGNSSHGFLLTNSYQLGTKFRVGFNVSGGQITYTYNGQPVVGYAQAKSFSGAYFKAGSYNQSGGNCTLLPSGPDAGKCDYAEVTIYTVQVCHSGACTGNAPRSTTPASTPVSTSTPPPVPPTDTPAATPTTTPANLPTAVPPTVPPTDTPIAIPTTTPANLPTTVPTDTPVATPTSLPAPRAGNVIYVSTTDGGKVDGISFKDEDILAFDSQTKEWQIYFDGSDVGLSSADVDAFAILNDGSLLVSFITGTKVPGIGNVDDSDLVRFIPHSLGPHTAGTFELYFDGSDVGLTTDGEDIDALSVLADGRLVISTKGPYTVPNLTGDDADLLLFTPQSLGENTQGTWSRYFKGDDHGFKPNSGEDISDVWLDQANPDAPGLYLTTHGKYQVDGLSGDNNDIFDCTLNATTACAFQAFWDGDANGLAGKAIDAIEGHIDLANVNLVSAAAKNEEDDGGAADDVEPAAEISANEEAIESTQTHRIFLPVIERQ